MKKIIIYLFSVYMFLTAAPVSSAVNIFFAGGQSNAKAEWAVAIGATLAASGRYQNVLLVHEIHPGNAIFYWYDNGAPQVNYEYDFFNSANDGALQDAITSTLAAGEEYVFSGFFWFQGEGDARTIEASLYKDRFLGMLTNLQQDLDGENLPSYHIVLAVIDNDPAYDDSLPAGRSKEEVELIRQVQIDLGVNYSFISSFDTRGYERVDAWHLTPESLALAGTGMANIFLGATIVSEDIIPDYSENVPKWWENPGYFINSSTAEQVQAKKSKSKGKKTNKGKKP